MCNSVISELKPHEAKPVSFGENDSQHPYLTPQEYAPAYLSSSLRRGHSGLGIASLVLGVVAGVAACVFFVVAGVLGSSSSMNQGPLLAVAVGVGMILVVMTTSFASGLAVGGLVQKDKSKAFAIIGLVVNILLILSLFALMLVGLTFAEPGRSF
jgi:hypothetical protein